MLHIAQQIAWIPTVIQPQTIKNNNISLVHEDAYQRRDKKRRSNLDFSVRKKGEFCRAKTQVAAKNSLNKLCKEPPEIEIYDKSALQIRPGNNTSKFS